MYLSLVFTFLFFFSSTLPTWAVTRYVAKTGSDSNSCGTSQTIGTPKLTIASSLTCMAVGDTLYIRAGTYTEGINTQSQTVPTGTSWSSPVTIAAYPGETVILQPSGFAVIQIVGNVQKYLIFDRLILDGTNTSSRIIDLDGVNQSGAGHIRFSNCEIRNSDHGAVLTGRGSDFNEFLNCHFHHNGLNPTPTLPFGHALYIQSSNNLVDGSEFDHHTGYGVHIYNGNAGQHANNNIIRNSLAYTNSTNTPFAAGILIGSGDGNMAYNNIAYGQPIGIKVGFGGSTNSKVYNNTVYNNSTDGIQILDSSTTATVKNNIAYNNGSNNINNYSGGTTLSNNLCNTSSATCALVNGTVGNVFIDAVNSNFGLVAGSTAINAGTAISGFLFNGSAPDIGAYETLQFGSAKIFNDPVNPDNKMEITIPSNHAAPLLPATGCTGFIALKGGVNNPILSCTRTAPHVMTLTLTNAYTSSDSAQFTYSTTTGNVTDSALIAGRLNQRLNSITTPQTVDVSTLSGGGGTTPFVTQGAFQFRSFGGTELQPDYTNPFNIGASLPPNSCTVLRTQISNTVASVNTAGYALCAQRNGTGGYAAVPNGPCTPQGICFVAGTGVNLPELVAGPTTEQLAAPGTFVPGAVQINNSQSPTVTLLTGQDTELVAAVCVGAGNSAGDIFDLRWYRAGIPLDAYTYTPTITIRGNTARTGNQ